jgi:peptidyl-tRNA hydrolase
MADLKMYICVREEVPAFMVPTLVAHTVLNNDTAYNNSCNWNHIEHYYEWKHESFKKCVVKVNEKEWSKILQIPFVFLGHENSTLGGEKSCAIPPIMFEYPNVIKFAKLWKP